MDGFRGREVWLCDPSSEVTPLKPLCIRNSSIVVDLILSESPLYIGYFCELIKDVFFVGIVGGRPGETQGVRDLTRLSTQRSFVLVVVNRFNHQGTRTVRLGKSTRCVDELNCLLFFPHS